MSLLTSGHFTAYVDAFDPDMPVIEISMSAPMYCDGSYNWSDELSRDMQALEKGIRRYIADIKALREEEKAYAV